MLKANEVLTLFALIRKADTTELKHISFCLQDEFILTYHNELNKINEEKELQYKKDFLSRLYKY